MTQKIACGPFVIERPEHLGFSDEQMERIMGAVRGFLHRLKEGDNEATLMLPPGCTMRSLSMPTDAHWNRLLAILQLTEQERSFLQAALEPDTDVWHALADYLAEHDHSAAKKLRALAAIEG